MCIRDRYYNSELNGTNGREYSYLNEDYGVTNSIEPATNGYNLVTSIDANVQKLSLIHIYVIHQSNSIAISSLLILAALCCFGAGVGIAGTNSLSSDLSLIHISNMEVSVLNFID